MAIYCDVLSWYLGSRSLIYGTLSDGLHWIVAFFSIENNRSVLLKAHDFMIDIGPSL